MTVSGGDVTGVDFGFAYNLIVNTDDDANADNARSKQGSLRQFIKNANAIGTAGGTTAELEPVPDSHLRSQLRRQRHGEFTIQPVRRCRALPSRMVLDGYTTQIEATSATPIPSGPEIELDGPNRRRRSSRTARQRAAAARCADS